MTPMPDSLHLFTHDATVPALVALGADDALGARVSELFLTALATGYRRGLTPLMAFHSARHLPLHDWQPLAFDPARTRFEADRVPCAVCGLIEQESCAPAELLADLHHGRCSLTPAWSQLLDLQALSTLPADATHFEPGHARTLHTLLELIADAPAGETPSALEKRIAKTKILPKSNLAARLWALRILAELGVLRCRTVADYSGALHFYPYSQRFAWELQMYEKTSGDPVWPFSLWRGGDGVNWAVARQVFPQLAHIL